AGIDASELKAVIGEYDALIVRSRTKVTRAILEAAQRLKVVGRAGVGIDNIDVDSATRRGIVVLNAPGGNVVSAAEHTFALMLALVRHV
ncbi:MAG: phosphoglycerate dehydrogenase, partial [Gemmatimonadetes bacterium]|nr:phosphoglycerate dehydrogenase [Gemmatimonadota bacterium]NIS00691.1 phosphoglycerate dehydrogenase [Gemmatimonadota bacterium]NIT66864.1 phosphoglycerate dehydrogenase [Gemmatimonadota bacterium]NIV23465.1 phosphoglycerate dehydrogenase [Gemmatimonadota bacterium]NIW76070.1 phosphoglycerate dehydrogenase [Gemmatimonadota bacterium]